MNLRSIFGKSPEVPYWAEGFQPAELDQFLAEVTTFFQSKPYAFEVNAAEGIVTWSIPEQGNCITGLHNVCIDYLHWSPAEREPELHDWLTMATAAFLGPGAAQLSKEEKLTGLRIKVMPPLKGYSPEPGNFRELESNLLAVLAMDEDGSVYMSNFAQDPDIGSIDDMFDRALENTLRALTTVQGTLPISYQNGAITIFQDPMNVYINTVALGFDLLTPTPLPYGIIAAMPDRHITITVAIGPGLSFDALQNLQRQTQEDFEESAYQTSPDVYWVQNRIFKRLEFGEESSPNLQELLALVTSSETN